MLYHLAAGQKYWSEDGVYAKIIIEGEKKACSDHIFEKTGMRMDNPSGQDGNTECGPLADLFVKPEHIKVIYYIPIYNIYNIIYNIPQ